MKPSGIGGQAVIEGVMMKNGNKYAVAVRKPNKEIAIETNTLPERKNKVLSLPIVRGVVAFVDSLSLGMKTLTFSASFYEEEEEESKFEKKLNEMTKGHADGILNGFTMVLAVVLAVGIFVVAPMLLAGFLAAKIDNPTVLAVLEGVFRLLIFVLYIVLIARMKDIKRLFMYHGAEHKSINCIENGLPLTVENVRKQSREHKRCGTSFMLTVMVISIIFFIFIRVENTLLRFVIRLLLIPVIAGVSYEFIRLAGRSNNPIVNILSRPGMWLQALTTREPDDSMIEVAMASVEAVFDWHAFIEKDSKKSKKNSKNSKNNKNNKGGKKPEPAKEEKKAEEAVAATQETVAAEELTATKEAAGEVPKQEEVKAEAPAQPLEIDIAQLFDIKLTSAASAPKKGKAPKKDPMPAATKAVAASLSKDEDDDDILKALDMYFEFKGPKSVMEISDEVEEDTEG
ncbi:MAG: DUF1385 domain-containing protein [Lachnospiraceae bacterium]|nr:DUF1385 domain-containing protein [Lachnospiraceae bacterium]